MTSHVTCGSAGTSGCGPGGVVGGWARECELGGVERGRLVMTFCTTDDADDDDDEVTAVITDRQLLPSAHLSV